MKNKLIILIAEVKTPSVDVTYLNAHAYVVDNTEDLDNAMADFKSKAERDNFKIMNALVFVPPIRSVLSIGPLQLVFNRVQKPPKPVRCDGGVKG